MMKIKDMTIICLLLSLWALLIGEGLFYLNFTPLSFQGLGKVLGIGKWESWLFFFGFLFVLMLLISLVYQRLNRQQKSYHLRYHIVFCLVLFMILNLALSFVPSIFQKMNLLSEIALLTWVIFVFYTLLYSIFYRNLLE